MFNDINNQDSETTELEIMEFTVADRHFGINVAKVVEIMQYTEITPMPNSNPFVEGVFKPRGTIMTVINLASYTSLPPSANKERDIMIITNFNGISTAFHVHTVEAIYRISWEDIEKPDYTIYGQEDGLATGIARINDRLITIIDFEKIIIDISPQSGMQIEDIRRMGNRSVSSKPILVVEDSPLLEKMLLEALETSGYSNIICCSNGQEAWNILKEFKDSNRAIEELVACVITDIEMPKMDGHRLIKLIRTDEKLRILPVIIFSSLINEDTKAEGLSIGATAQITKTEIRDLVTVIDEYIL